MSRELVHVHENLVVNITLGKVYVDDVRINLTINEYRTLLQFVRHEGKVLSVAYLKVVILGVGYSKPAMYAHINRLRKKIESDLRRCRHIVTVPGGYVMPKEY